MERQWRICSGKAIKKIQDFGNNFSGVSIEFTGKYRTTYFQHSPARAECD